MDHLHHFLQYFGQHPKTGITSVVLSFVSATLAFVFAKWIPSAENVKVICTVCASLVSMTAGVYAIRYYRLQIRKLNQTP
jgi:hypothetical protein